MSSDEGAEGRGDAARIASGGDAGGASALIRILSLPVAPVFRLMRLTAAQQPSPSSASVEPGDIALHIDAEARGTAEKKWQEEHDPLGLVIGSEHIGGLTSPALLQLPRRPRHARSARDLSQPIPGVRPYVSPCTLRQCTRHLNEQRVRFLIYQRQRQYHEKTIPRFRLKVALAEEAARKAGDEPSIVEQESGGWCDYCGKQDFETHLRRCRCHMLWFCKSKCRRKAWDMHGKYCKAASSTDDDEEESTERKDDEEDAMRDAERRPAMTKPTQSTSGETPSALRNVDRRTATSMSKISSNPQDRIGRFVRVASGRYRLADKLARSAHRRYGATLDGATVAESGCDGLEIQMDVDEKEMDRGFIGGPATSVPGEKVITWREVGTRGSSSTTSGDTKNSVPVLELLLLSPVPSSSRPLVSACLAKDREGVVNTIHFYFGDLPDGLKSIRRSKTESSAATERESQPWFRGGMMPSAYGSGGLILRWRWPRRLETFLDGSKGARIDEFDIKNMQILRLICDRD